MKNTDKIYIQNIKKELELICDDITEIDDIVKSIDFYWESSGSDLLKERFSEDYEEQASILEELKNMSNTLRCVLSESGDSEPDTENIDFLPVNIFE